jgi:hypothetical protein
LRKVEVKFVVVFMDGREERGKLRKIYTRVGRGTRANVEGKGKDVEGKNETAEDNGW